MSQNEIKRAELLNYLDILYPNASCELNYRNDYELLVAIILSAQTTDKAVNSVTKKLFGQYPNFETLKGASLATLEEIIKPLGLAKTKSTNLLSLAKDIVDKYGNNIPTQREELMRLKGIGYKTATLFLTMKGYLNGFTVDTHVKRVSKRLGLTTYDDPIKISHALEDYFHGLSLDKIHHQFIFFGRYFCKAKDPNCEECQLKTKCQWGMSK